jgi:hypothetical protein
VFDKVGGYDLSFRWYGFLDLFYRALASGCRFFVVPITILNTYQTWQSDTRVNIQNPAFRAEHLRVTRKHLGAIWGAWHYFDGTLNPARLFVWFLRRAAAKLGFHPRKIYGRFSSSIKNALLKVIR